MVDHGLVMWWVFAVIALRWTLAWELIKYAGWQLYFSVTPGAGSRRLQRVQRIRASTAEAINRELGVRRRAVAAERDSLFEAGNSSSSTTRRPTGYQTPEMPLGARTTAYRADQRDRAVRTTGPSFAFVQWCAGK